jgi:hypothetical protein
MRWIRAVRPRSPNPMAAAIAGIAGRNRQVGPVSMSAAVARAMVTASKKAAEEAAPMPTGTAAAGPAATMPTVVRAAGRVAGAPVTANPFHVAAASATVVAAAVATVAAGVPGGVEHRPDSMPHATEILVSAATAAAGDDHQQQTDSDQASLHIRTSRAQDAGPCNFRSCLCPPLCWRWRLNNRQIAHKHIGGKVAGIERIHTRGKVSRWPRSVAFPGRATAQEPESRPLVPGLRTCRP